VRAEAEDSPAAGPSGVSEKMSGGLTFLTHGHLTVGVYGDGLIMRIGAAGMGAAVAGLGMRPWQLRIVTGLRAR
jgi:hypothetical protein